MNQQSFGYVEDSIRQRLVEWINQIINEENLPFDRADAQIEIRFPDGTKIKFPDIVIWKERLIKPVCLIELKQPLWSPADWSLFNDAQIKALNASPQIPYFGTWNINELILWKTFEEEALSWEERRKGIYHFAKIKNLREIDYPEVETKIKESIRNFLKDLVEIYTERKVLPTIPIDEFFIYSLRTIVDSLYFPITIEIKKYYQKDKKFKKALNVWFTSQGWNVPSTNEDFEKVARQFLYLLINKVMFYNTLRKSKGVKPLQISEDIKDDSSLKLELQKYFDIAKEVTQDYETIFGFDFLEKIPIPSEIIPNLISFLNGLSKYDFTKIGYKDLGHIFDSLIPSDERHNLGQYYTNPDVVDIINSFCIRNANDKVADFGCGAGTFLVRAYSRIKYLDPTKNHQEILKQLLGVDISKFAAHLSMINLATKDLSQIENYPLILCKDFFDIIPSRSSKWFDTKKETIETLSGKKIQIEVPAILDAIVGNPPYTRQEKLEIYKEDYKKKLQEVLEKDWGKGIKIGKRAGIYAYFFLHGLRFLKNGGRFGYITSNSWLDVDYGKYLQEFFLNHCKIIAIIESKERVFPDADINTVITILERCDDKKERENNLVKFVQLKIPLKELVNETDENKRFSFLDKLVQQIEKTNKLYEDDKLRIFPKLQKELWEEGYDEKGRQYAGSKWGKYIRAPNIFFKILKRGQEIFLPLGNCVYGIKTGNNNFFIPDKVYFKINEENENYLIKDKKLNKTIFNIEKKFIVPVAESPQSYSNILIKDLKHLIYVTKEKMPSKKDNIIKYLKWGESEGFNESDTCKRREIWYLQPKVPPSYVIIPKSRFDSFRVFYSPVKIHYTDSFNGILGFFGQKKYAKYTAAILNSTVYYLILELYSRTVLGQGATSLMRYEMEKLPMINYKKLPKELLQKLENIFDRICVREIGTVFEEIGANSPEEVSFDKVKPDRRELDKIIMNEILGLTEEEQLEVYRAVVKLVKERIERAKSVEKRKKVKGADPEALAEGILREVNISKLKKFPDEYIGDYEYEVRKVPEGKPELGSDLKGFFVKVDDKRINCDSSEEAQWIYYAILNGITSVKIPKNKKVMKDILKEYSNTYKKIQNEIKAKLESYILDRKLREKVQIIINKKILK
jgi:methylase of polypeptide subunit release factors